MNYINSYCHISNNYIKVDGKVTKSFESKSIDEVIREIYLSLGLKYSKFHKMDQLSKIAFLAVVSLILVPCIKVLILCINDYTK